MQIHLIMGLIQVSNDISAVLMREQGAIKARYDIVNIGSHKEDMALVVEGLWL